MKSNTFLAIVVAVSLMYGSQSVVFTITNKCPYTIWPATSTESGKPTNTGFELASRASTTVSINEPWSGRLWGRFQCSTVNGRFTCRRGDCGTGQVQCNGADGLSPVTLAEFTLAGPKGFDFFDVSIVDGFNLPMKIQPDNGYPPTACPVDINNHGCPNELAVRDPNGGVIGCKSACTAFQKPRYCCTGAYSKPDRCKPTKYSQIFKQQCPEVYSYPYDDSSSILTSPSGANYHITFCPYAY